MRLAAASLVLALGAAPATAEVLVRVAGGQVDLTASAAPLADVLDRLARQTGMKVVYEGPAPRQLVTVSLHGRTPAETILAVFEGLGLNFALVADPSGASVQTLVVAGAATATPASSASSAAGRAAARPNLRRPFGPPPGSSPETVDPAFDEVDNEPEPEEPDFGLPPGVEAPDPGGAQAPNVPVPASIPGQGPVPAAAPPGAAPGPPAQPPSPFSASPFTPQPQQPFPQPRPGAPTATNPAPGPDGNPAPPPPQ